MKRLSNQFSMRAFGRDERGGFALLTVMMLMTLMLFAGGAMDYSRAQMAKERLQFAVDSGGLAIGRIDKKYDDPKDVAAEYVRRNIEDSVIEEDSLIVNTTIDESTNARSVHIRATAEVEMYFGSFYGVEKVQVAAETETLEAYQDLEVTLVLDISGSMRWEGRIDEMKDAAKAFVEQIFEDERDAEFRSVSIVPYAGQTRLPANFSDRLLPAYDTARWTGCLDSADEIMNDDLPTVGAYHPIPNFYRWASNDLPVQLTWCPPAASAILAHQNDKSVLTTYIDNLEMGDGTGTDTAIAWGLKTLSPDTRGILTGAKASAPASYDSDVSKVLVVMTDGNITDQFRDDDYDFETHYHTGFDPDVDPPLTNGSDRKYTRGEASANFRDVCAAADAQPTIRVFTVGFKVNNADMLTLLRNCATSEEYYFTPQGGELEEVFRNIASKIEQLRLVM